MRSAGPVVAGLGPDGGAVTTGMPSVSRSDVEGPSNAKTGRPSGASADHPQDHTEFTEAFHRVGRGREHEAVISTGYTGPTARIDVSAFGDTAHPIPRPPVTAAAITGIAAPAAKASGSAATS